MEYIQAILYTFNCILYPLGRFELYYIFAAFVLAWYCIKKRPQLKFVGAAFFIAVVCGLVFVFFHPMSGIQATAEFLTRMFFNVVVLVYVVYNCRKWNIFTWAWSITVIHALFTLVAAFSQKTMLWSKGNGADHTAISRLRLFYREPQFLGFTCGILLIFYIFQLIKRKVDWRAVAGLVICLIDLYYSVIRGGINTSLIIMAFCNSYNSIREQTGLLGLVTVSFIAFSLAGACILYGRLLDGALCIYIIVFQFAVGHLKDPSSWFIYGWILADCLDERHRRQIERAKAEGRYAERPMRPLRIAQIGHKRIPGREGGVEIVVQELSERLVRQGHTVVAYNRGGHHVSGKEFDITDYDNIKECNGVKIVTIPTINKMGFSALIYAVLASVHIAVSDYDIVHYHAEGPGVMCWLPSLFGIPVVSTIHGLDWQRKKWGGAASKLIKMGERMIASQAEVIIVLSKHVKDYFWDTYHRKAVYIPNGITQPQKKSARIITDKWGLKKGTYILFLGRIVPEKCPHYLIEVYKALEAENPSRKLPKLVIAGGVSDTDAYMQHLKLLAGSDSNIIFTGFVQGKVLDELYSNAYLYVLPSDVEGMPISLLEAMSYGCACLVSDISECTEVIREHGLTFRAGDVADLQRQLSYAINHPEIMEKFQEESADFICSRHNWEKNVDATIEEYYRAWEKRKW